MLYKSDLIQFYFILDTNIRERERERERERLFFIAEEKWESLDVEAWKSFYFPRRYDDATRRLFLTQTQAKI